MSKANTKEQEPKEQKSMAREILEMVFYLVIALLAALFIVNFVGQRTQVDGHSMDPTLADGQNLILDKVSYRFRDPERMISSFSPLKRTARKSISSNESSVFPVKPYRSSTVTFTSTVRNWRVISTAQR